MIGLDWIDWDHARQAHPDRSGGLDEIPDMNPVARPLRATRGGE
jgi:hypothetical protein